MNDLSKPRHDAYPDTCDSDEVDLAELFQALWRDKWWIISTTVLAAMVSVLYALWLPDKYTASALVAPVSEGGGGGLSMMASQYGGLASLAGVSMNIGEVSKRQITLQTLQSRQFLTDFIRRHELKVALLASQGWDAHNQQWLIDSERFDSTEGDWLAGGDQRGNPEPSDWQAFKVLRNKLTVSEDRDSGMVTLSLESLSPVAAQQWLGWLVTDINEHLKNREMQETQRNIAYLEQQLERTSVAGMRQVFYSLIEEQSKTLMLAELDPEFAFKVIDPPLEPEEPSGPQRSLVVVLAVLLAGMLSSLGVLTGYALRKRV